MSVGCLAVGDAAAEEVFVLSALVEIERVKVIISPTDFRTGTMLGPGGELPWVRGLYESLREEMRSFGKES